MEKVMKNILFRFLVAMTLAVSAWSSTAYAQALHSEVHEEREDQRQEDVVRNMHFADDVLKKKFLEVYVPYQERLFHIDHELRDLIIEYVNAQTTGQPMSGQKARELLTRGLKIQSERNEILTTFIGRLMKTEPGGVALQAWLVENKLRAATASVYLEGVPFVTQ
jgi:hypothetical protein